MKTPFTLVLISALIAAPLFADTVTLKSGQTLTGEIIRVTKEYVKFKTESGVLVIPISYIAKITTSGAEGGQALMPEAVAMADAAAEAEAQKIAWFAAGCLANVFGVIGAFSVKPSPPESYLIGKSPEYVVIFTEAYKQKAKSIQMEMAGMGCLVNTVVACGCVIVGLSESKCYINNKEFGE